MSGQHLFDIIQKSIEKDLLLILHIHISSQMWLIIATDLEKV